MAATGENSVPHACESSPAIVIPAHCSDRSGARHVFDEILQRLNSATPVHEVAAEQDDIGALVRHDVAKPIQQVRRPVFAQMKVAHKEDPLAEAELRDRFTADEKRPAGPDLQLFQKV